MVEIGQYFTKRNKLTKSGLYRAILSKKDFKKNSNELTFIHLGSNDMNIREISSIYPGLNSTILFDVLKENCSYAYVPDRKSFLGFKEGYLKNFLIFEFGLEELPTRILNYNVGVTIYSDTTKQKLKSKKVLEKLLGCTLAELPK